MVGPSCHVRPPSCDRSSRSWQEVSTQDSTSAPTRSASSADAATTAATARGGSAGWLVGAGTAAAEDTAAPEASVLGAATRGDWDREPAGVRLDCADTGSARQPARSTTMETTAKTD